MKKKHILLIENDENEVEFFTEALEESSLDFLCSTARNAEQAVIMLKSIIPDIIFLDVQTSRSAGSGLLNKIKQIQGLREIPVIMYSNVPPKKNKRTVYGNDASSYLQLPGNVQTMASMLQYLLHSDN
jgi:DNA-binding NtrC family response regulator